VRPGDNLYSNSVVALDAKNGAVLGYIQLVKNDYHDWDVSAGPVLLTTRVDDEWLPPPTRMVCSRRSIAAACDGAVRVPRHVWHP
jgi:glucose dehydrogenase